MRRKKPVADHTSALTPPAELVLQPIGIVRSPYTERFGTPRQPVVVEQTLEERVLDGEIHLNEGANFEQALRGLEGFDYIWVIYWFHLNQGWNPMVTPPRGPKEKQGLFATRAPHRPNPVGLSALRLAGVEGRVLKVRGLDMIDGTPVLDIKPYVPYADAFADARAGWLDRLDEPGDGPDRYGQAGG